MDDVQPTNHNDNASHQMVFRVYYEDTDAGGIIYHARYLHFMERARTEWLRQAGIDHQRLAREHSQGFVVAGIAIKYRHPAYLDDLIGVETRVVRANRARMRLQQTIYRLNQTQQTATVMAEMTQLSDVNAADWQRCAVADVDLSIVSWSVPAQEEREASKDQEQTPHIVPSRLSVGLFHQIMQQSN